jgi:hypothetical protein
MRPGGIRTAFQEAGITGGSNFPMASGRVGRTDGVRNMSSGNHTQNQILVQDCRTGSFL